MSDVIRTMDALVNGARKTSTKTQLAQAFGDQLCAVVRVFPWKADDWTRIMARYGGAETNRVLFGDYAPLGSSSMEGWYALACDANNPGAARSFERWAGRPRYPCPPGHDPKGLRCLRVGEQWWCAERKERLFCTSLNAERAIACSYHDPEPGQPWSTRKVRHRYTILAPT